MGQLISRAIRRITQGKIIQQEHPQAGGDTAQDLQTTSDQPQAVAQPIPVGQSLDSNDTNDQLDKQPLGNNLEQQEGEQRSVEEAAIKIQAFVRGHLTRKALKQDASLQQTSTTTLPQPVSVSALGQSQFDEQSLLSNPAPNAIFEAPLKLKATESHQLVESVTGTTSATTNKDADNINSKQPIEHKPKLDLRSVSSPAQFELTDGASLPKGVHETKASIDLGSPTSAAASIDILDHNLRPIDQFSSVLHLKESPTKSDAGSQDQELAAIRIQSAFRGYRSRKNSPYRSLSPSCKLEQRQQQQQQVNKDLEASQTLAAALANVADDDEDEETDEIEGAKATVKALNSEGRRSSRARVREELPKQIPAASSDPEQTYFSSEAPDPGEPGQSYDKTPQLQLQDEGDNYRQDFGNQKEEEEEGEEEEEVEEADTVMQMAAEFALEEAQREALDQLAGCRPIGRGSEASSLGAALSLNVDEDEELESEVRRLVEDLELTGGPLADRKGPARRLSELEAEPEPEPETEMDDLPALVEEPALSSSLTERDEAEEEEPLLESARKVQQELDSDDIERRDPRGQVSELRQVERQSSLGGGQIEAVVADWLPPTTTDTDQSSANESSAIAATATTTTVAADYDDDKQALLAPPDEPFASESGRSSPAFSNSSNGNGDESTSNDDEAEEEPEEGGAKVLGDDGAQTSQSEQQQQQAPNSQTTSTTSTNAATNSKPGSRNKNRRNNRNNKRKGKK